MRPPTNPHTPRNSWSGVFISIVDLSKVVWSREERREEKPKDEIKGLVVVRCQIC
jgi:hypothetical protein